ncbi:sigma-B regulation protein RsbU (phosphoserine phosphatase) [Pedobacter sp. CAN_A7]|uniref:SpoIIE family protein phosphatase n=1 Tax=Pedobacter sp. CAN_A7 TaxID=2787722 RepID=UPI0018C9C2AD
MNKTVLLVDDDLFQLKLYEKLLQNNGYTCRIALSVDEAEIILANFDIPDLIISDYEMPDKNGFEFRKRLLKNNLLKNVPFLFLTSVNDEHFIQQGLDLKAIDYMAKDVPPMRILSKINNLMLAVREHYERSLSELKGIAEKLSLRNIPKTPPQLKNFSLQYFNHSYQDQPGGDFIDFIQINDRFTFVILGDVMGKKWGAWFFSFSYLSYVRSAIRLCVFDGDFSLSTILHKLNRVVYADEFLSDIFSTISIVLIDDENCSLCYSGAGDLPLLKYDSQTKEITAFQSEGILLGFSEDASYSELEIMIQGTDEVFLVTDGMIDFEINGEKKSDMELFKRKLHVLKENNHPTEEIVDNLFNKHTSQVDDCSIVIIKRTKNEVN